MPSKKPSAERIEQVKTQFQVVESKISESSKESGKERHFRLPYDTALEAVDADLSKTAYRLWIYLSANYPFADREVDLPSQTELGIRLGVTRQAINIAAAELQAVGLWDFWAERWKGRNLKGFKTPKESVEKTRQVSKKDDTLSKKSDTECQKEMTGCQKKMTPCQKNLTPTPPEPLPEADSKTSQTYTDFIQTLSEGEREKFLDWSKKKVSSYENKVVDIHNFLAAQNVIGKNYWEIFYKEFQQETTENQLETSQDKQNEILDRRSQSQEFLSRRTKDLDSDQNSAVGAEKSAVMPSDFAEVIETLDEPEERLEELKRGANSTGVDRDLVDKLKKKAREKRGFGFRNKKT